MDEPNTGIDAGLLVYERDRALLGAFARLGDRCQHLLRLLMADPRPSYDEIAAALDMPVGSIGPTQGRCLDVAREQLRHSAGTTDRPPDVTASDPPTTPSPTSWTG